MVTMLKNRCSVWKRIKFLTFWYNCYYFTWSDTYFIQWRPYLSITPRRIFVENHNEGNARSRYLGEMEIVGKIVCICVNWIRLDSFDGISSMSKACLTGWRNLTCTIDCESYADSSATSGSAFSAGQVLSEVLDSDIQTGPEGWRGWVWGWHPHLLKNQLTRNSDNGDPWPENWPKPHSRRRRMPCVRTNLQRHQIDNVVRIYREVFFI